MKCTKSKTVLWIMYFPRLAAEVLILTLIYRNFHNLAFGGRRYLILVTCNLGFSSSVNKNKKCEYLRENDKKQQI